MTINHYWKWDVIFSNGIATGTLVMKQKAFEVKILEALNDNED